MVAFEDERLLFAVNPILELPLAGSEVGSGPSFAPAAMAKLKAFGRVAFGLEYYADFGPFSGFAAAREQQHYLFEAVDLLGVQHWELNAGVGEGLSEASNALVLKVILGYSWGKEPPP